MCCIKILFMKELILLSLSFDNTDSPIYGLDRNPGNVSVQCEHCIGACCIGPEVALDCPGESGTLQRIHGLVGRAVLPESYQGTPNRLFGKTTTKKLLNDRGAVRLWASKVNSAIDQASASPTNTSLKGCGPCGELLPNGCCNAHDKPRPGICLDIQAGDEVCAPRFVAIGSPAALIIQQILNKHLSLLNEVRRTLGLEHSTQLRFDFTKK